MEPSPRVLIVGAGPYGIAIAQELWHRGVSFDIVGEPFELWHRHTLRTMKLRSDPRGSEVPSRDRRYDFLKFLRSRNLDDSHKARVPVVPFRDYLREVTDALPFDIHRAKVEHLERRGDGFVARCDDGAELTGRFAVLATGSGAHRHLPEALRALPAERVLHSWDTEAIEALAGQRVLVLGAGQSAAESVEALADTNRVTWAPRHEPLFFREPLRLPTPLFKASLAVSSAFYYIPPALLRLFSKAVFRTTVTPDLQPVWTRDDVETVIADADGLELRSTDDGIHSGRTGETYDAVVAATGYRYSLRGLPFLADPLRSELGDPDAVPTLDRSFQTPAPGVFLVGGIAEGAFGPAQRFLLGARHAAPRIARALQNGAG